MTTGTTGRKPLPNPTPETQPFWDGCKEHRLVLPRCRHCDKFHYYPRAHCPHCWSRDLDWVQVSGKGKLYSYLINHRPAPGFEDDAPYSIAVVELEEGPRMLTNIVEVAQTPEELKLDMPVEVVFDDASDSVTLPKFRPTS